VSDTPKFSPLHDLHVELGGRLVPFAGWQMPVMYRSILEEHEAVRTAAGIFDISHMGQFTVRGKGSGRWLNRMLANDLGKLDDGRGQYTFLLNPDGGVIDDLIVYRLGEDDHFLVVNAAKLDEDFAWLRDHAEADVAVSDESEVWAGLAVQGPRAVAAFEKVFPGQTPPPRNGIAVMNDGEIVCRTGYTGEDGFELFCPVERGARTFQAFLDAGVTPCGLGARDSLRLEKCLPLNGNDLSPGHTPLEAGLGFFVALDKGEFIGRDALLRQKSEGLTRRLAAIEYLEKGAPPRAGYPVLSEDGEALGELTSGAPSPTLGKGIAMAYLPPDFSAPGTRLQIDVRGRKVPATVVKKPFYKTPSKSS
jgi:aminomethyltransferase